MNSTVNLPPRRTGRLMEITRDLASTLDLDTLLRRIVQVAIELSQTEEASILLYDEHKQELYFHSTSNPNLKILLRGLAVPAESIAGWAALHRETVFVNDAHEDHRFFNEVEKQLNYPTHSIAAIPLIAKQKLVGVLEVINKRDGDFTPEDQEVLQVLAAQAAVAIENARLFQQFDLISEFTHELRTPLTAIASTTLILRQPNLSEEERLRFIDSIQDEVKRLSQMTTDFLDLARLESGRMPFKLKTVKLNEIILECALFFHAEIQAREIELSLDLPDRPAELQGDRERLRQLILNLLSNAVKYNHTGGKITLQVVDGVQNVQMVIADTGIGIPAEDLPHLFERFYRSTRVEDTSHGSGLGLAICKQIVESHGGSIQVQSSLNAGTTFTLQLPKG
ncbi:MAG: GAF domain-containing sensor histidine kinase [Chloroflexi bacterium]|nr:GAF domain-containing sensor histidine kinase [Chloroflexota bacterium]